MWQGGEELTQETLRAICDGSFTSPEPSPAPAPAEASRAAAASEGERGDDGRVVGGGEGQGRIGKKREGKRRRKKARHRVLVQEL